MTTKQEFTKDEWDPLLAAPVHAATYLMLADMSFMGVIREMKALGKFVSNPAVPEAARELISCVTADIQDKSKNREKPTTAKLTEKQDPREPARQGLNNVADLVEAKCSLEEAVGFKQLAALGCL